MVRSTSGSRPRPGDPRPGAAVHQRAGGVGGPVAAVGPGGEQRHAGHVVELGGGGEGQFLTAAAEPSRGALRGTRWSPLPTRSSWPRRRRRGGRRRYGCRPRAPRPRGRTRRPAPGCPSSLRTERHAADGEAVARDHVGGHVSEGGVARLRGVGQGARGLALEEAAHRGGNVPDCRPPTRGAAGLRGPRSASGAQGPDPTVPGSSPMTSDMQSTVTGRGASAAASRPAPQRRQRLRTVLTGHDVTAAAEEKGPEGWRGPRRHAVHRRGGQARRAAREEHQRLVSRRHRRDRLRDGLGGAGGAGAGEGMVAGEVSEGGVAAAGGRGADDHATGRTAVFDSSSTATAAPAMPAAALPSAMRWTGARGGQRPVGQFLSHGGGGIGGPERRAVEVEQEFTHSLVWGPGPCRPRSTP